MPCGNALKTLKLKVSSVKYKSRVNTGSPGVFQYTCYIVLYFEWLRRTSDFEINRNLAVSPDFTVSINQREIKVRTIQQIISFKM